MTSPEKVNITADLISVDDRLSLASFMYTFRYILILVYLQ